MAKLDFYFDYNCPWCYLAAFTVRELAAEGVAIDYHVWKMPEDATPPPKPEGYMEAAGLKLRELREQLNVKLSSPIQKETIPALTATKVASAMGKAEAFVEAAFRAHWGDKQDISEESLLVQIAAEIGLDADKFQSALRDGSGRAAMEADLQKARELNIDTIPSYLNGGMRLLIHHFEDMPTLEQLRQLAQTE
ncbi:putative DsbA family dithiol-disulfide isomerase [Tumebacillus sp. BK434]|uniref:DsbA family oxidoreductase n=1 Tax=Tumebacillus sp. BK434 TaxID=2512169 RepID=UPI0010D5C625|nr:DsbA family protein [Tumebacillus sp. BK434]TCP55434.1 putative DsbA family dithiol-disulfide isomerase [Tumebacillus sp. BK434]